MARVMDAFNRLFASIEGRTAQISASSMERRKRASIAMNRDVTWEAYSCHSGAVGATSLRTILRSWPQFKVVLLAGWWYVFQFLAYVVLSNYLIYVTFHDVSPDSPSYPGVYAANGTDPYYHRELHDVALLLLPHWSTGNLKRFLDMNVSLATSFPPLILLLTGRTKRLVNYVGCLGLLNILKGVVQLTTIEPPVHRGEHCWRHNFSTRDLNLIRNNHFGTQWYHLWGMMSGCNDMMWSGHIEQSSLGFLFLLKTLRDLEAPATIRSLVVVYYFAYAWMVLLCRIHYTSDVIVGSLVAALMFTHSPFRFGCGSSPTASSVTPLGRSGRPATRGVRVPSSSRGVRVTF